MNILSNYNFNKSPSVLILAKEVWFAKVEYNEQFNVIC